MSSAALNAAMASSYDRQRCASTPSTACTSASRGAAAAARLKSANVAAGVAPALGLEANCAACSCSRCLKRGWCASHARMKPVASSASSSFVWLTPSDNKASRSLGSASCALVAAAMARRSSSFSACTVLSKRQPSHDAGSARTAASSASAASESTPRRNKSRPTAKASARPRYGFGSTNSYRDRSRELSSAFDSSPMAFHTESCVHWSTSPRAAIAWNSPAQSPPRSANSSAQRCASLDPEGPAARALAARNSLAHGSAGSAATTPARPSVRSAAYSDAHASPTAFPAFANSSGAARRSVTLSPSATSSPRDMRDMNCRNCELRNFPSGSAASVAASRADCAAVSACAAVSGADDTAPADSCSCRNSDAHASPAREEVFSAFSRNSDAHAAPADCLTPLNSSAHETFGPASRPPGPGTAAAVTGTAGLSESPRDTRMFAKSSTHPEATEAAATFPPSSRNRRRASAAVSGDASDVVANGAAPTAARAPWMCLGPSIRASPAWGLTSTPSGASASASRACTTPWRASACRCRAMMADRARITVFSAGDRFRGR
mmetsp:Transcript_13971/g.58800  ORF Transcript_13971/g.58800 Transcript_13971/m.58800 type:complete len:553 (+) Transcript_13971:395-2053(+)